MLSQLEKYENFACMEVEWFKCRLIAFTCPVFSGISVMRKQRRNVAAIRVGLLTQTLLSPTSSKAMMSE